LRDGSHGPVQDRLDRAEGVVQKLLGPGEPGPSEGESDQGDEQHQADHEDEQPFVAKQSDRRSPPLPAFHPQRPVQLAARETVPLLAPRNRSRLSSAFPVPTATQSRGFSATSTGMPVSRDSSLSRLRSSAPPPVSTMPRSMMSAASSGGVRSRVSFTASTMAPVVSARASVISSE